MGRLTSVTRRTLTSVQPPLTAVNGQVALRPAAQRVRRQRRHVAWEHEPSGQERADVCRGPVAGPARGEPEQRPAADARWGGIAPEDRTAPPARGAPVSTHRTVEPNVSRVDLPAPDEPVAGRSPHLSRRRRRRSAVVPVLLALLTAAALAEADVDRPVASVAWLAIGPLTASLLLTWTWTALVGGYAMLLGTLVVATRPGDPQTAAMQLLVLGALSAFAVGNCVLRERRERQLRTVLRVARVAQGAILQPVPARSSRMHFGARYRSADPQAQVGGDVLDVRPTPRGARVLVADVRGHGLPAVQLAAVVAASFREACARPGLSLVEVARYVDHSVELLASDEELATAVFLDLDEAGSVVAVRAPDVGIPRISGDRGWLPAAVVVGSR